MADPSDKPALPTAIPDPDIGLPVAGSLELVVDITQFRQLLPRDAIFPVYEPRFVDRRKPHPWLLMRW